MADFICMVKTHCSNLAAMLLHHCGNLVIALQQTLPQAHFFHKGMCLLPRICYQFSLHATSLSRHVAVCTALVCGAERNAPCQRDLAIDKANLQRLQWNVRAMIRQICNVRPQDIVTTRSNELLVRLGIEDLDLILKQRRLRWYGHVERSNGAVKTDIQVDGKHGPGRPKMTWKQLTERDCREWKISAINPHDRHTWRSGVRSAMLAASQLSGRGPTGVDVAPVAAR